MFCTSCGQQIPDGKKYCPKCGAPILVGREREEQQETQTFDGSVKEKARQVQPNDKKASFRRKPIAIAGIAVALLTAVGVGAVYLNAPSLEGSRPASITYGSSKVEKVSPDAKIVLYGSNGEKLEDYELTVTDSNGDQATYRIGGDSFSPSQVGATEGKTSFSVKDASTGEELKADVVVNDNGSSNIEVKPSGDGVTDNKSGKKNSGKEESKGRLTSSGKYGLYLDKVEELEAKYGEAQYIEMSSGDDWHAAACDGVGFIGLVDLDGDGFEELIVAHPMEAKDIVSDDYANMMDGQYYLKTVEVWTIENEHLKQVGSFSVYPAVEGASYLYILDADTQRANKMLYLQSMYLIGDTRTYETFAVTSDLNGRLRARTETIETRLSTASGNESSTTKIDGVETSSDEANNEWKNFTGIGNSGSLGAGVSYRLNGTEYDEADGASAQGSGSLEGHTIKDTVEFARQQKEALQSKASRK